MKILDHFIIALFDVEYLELGVGSDDFGCFVVLLSSEYLREASLD